MAYMHVCILEVLCSEMGKVLYRLDSKPDNSGGVSGVSGSSSAEAQRLKYEPLLLVIKKSVEQKQPYITMLN